MKRSTLTVALYMLAVFASGMLVGAFGHKLYSAHSVSAGKLPPPTPPRLSPEEYRRKIVAEMRTRLQLEEPQVTKLNAILDETRDRFRITKDRHRAEAEEIKQDQRNQIRAMLNPGQQAEYQKFLEERERKAKEAAAKEEAAKKP
jgi:hypothetical protein